MLLWGVKKKAARDADPRERGLWGDLMSIGMVFPIAILLGLFGGRWIGAKLGHQDLGQWIGLGLGIGAAFWELYKVSLKLDRYDEAARSRTPPDEPDERP
ncbi:MAG TPA: AtpZ/AtpI family protein [Holophagaceae bacterium]|nr:AtpZ/AtpI family protein [Holophagaceae bacterium]